MRPGRPPKRRNLARLRIALAAVATVAMMATSGLAAPGRLNPLEASGKHSADDWRAQQTPNIEASQRLSDMIDDRRGEAPLAQAMVLAQAVTYDQARLGGIYLSTPVGLPGHPTPSSALDALIARHGVAPSAAQRSAIAALDDLAEPLGSGLTRMINAHLAFEDAAFHAFAFADLGYLQTVAEAAAPGEEGLPPASTANGTSPLETLRNAGIDAGPPMAARIALLEASLYLQWAWLVTTRAAPSARPATSDALCTHESVVAVPPAFAIDVEGADNCYGAEYSLLIDFDGADIYNAKSGNVGIDLGGDDDLHLARNGGANRGAGFLLDDDGNDTYTAGAGGTNGGAEIGIGFLLDAGAGNDIYTAGGDATNGGALSGVGTLIDSGGNDIYSAGDNATNGGAGVSLGLPASGFLLDAAGDDDYTGGRKGTNGGSTGGSLGYLLDAGRGTDAYTSEGTAANGGGLFGLGFLFDVGGDGDSYVVNGPGRAANGATAGPGGASAGPSPPPGAGLLLDGGGLNDTYRDADADASGTDRTKVPKGSVGAQVDRCSPSAGSASVNDLVRGGCPARG